MLSTESFQVFDVLRYTLFAGLFGFWIWVTAICIYRLTWHPLAKYPGPFLAKLTDFYGAYYSARGILHVKTWQDHQRWGTFVRQGPHKLLVNSVAGSNDICFSKNLQKSKGYLPMVPAPGAFNIHTAIDKTIHKHKKKVMSQGLSEQSVRSFEPTMLAEIDIFLKNIASFADDKRGGEWSAPLNMTKLIQFLAYDIMGGFGFGRSFELQTKPDNRFITDAVAAASLRSGVYSQYPELAKFKLEKIIYPNGSKMYEKFKQVAGALVAERSSAKKDSQNDLFSFIIDARDPETGLGFSHTEIWSEARFLLVAGADTSTTALSAAFFYLIRNPTCYDKLTSEIRNIFSSASEIQSGIKLSQCHYLRACIDETMRMSPPAGGTLWREVCEGGIVIDNQFIPAGYDVGYSIYALHHNEEYFPDSYIFKPERWIESEDNTKEAIEQSRLAFSPFSAGSRGCAGKAMAYKEISNTLAITIWYMDFRRPDGPLGLVGEGVPGSPDGRSVVGEFQLEDHLTSFQDGPYIQFRIRKEVEQELGELWPKRS